MPALAILLSLSVWIPPLSPSGLHRIERTKLLDTCLHHLLYLLELCNIRNRYAGLPTHALDLLGHFLTALIVCGDIVDADIVAVASKSEGNGFADPAARACYDRSLPTRVTVTADLLWKRLRSLKC